LQLRDAHFTGNGPLGRGTHEGNASPVAALMGTGAAIILARPARRRNEA
jgi:hypothetical protein